MNPRVLLGGVLIAAAFAVPTFAAAGYSLSSDLFWITGFIIVTVGGTIFALHRIHRRSTD